MRTEFKRPSPDEPAKEPIPNQLPQHNFRYKQWTRTKGDSRYKEQDTRNFVIDQAYMALLKKVKALYQGTNTEAFELNIRYDKRYSSVGMHDFCTSAIYLELECGHDLKCIVKYDFEHCTEQEEILALMHSIYPLKDVSLHQPLKGGVSACFKRIKQLHPESCFTRL